MMMKAAVEMMMMMMIRRISEEHIEVVLTFGFGTFTRSDTAVPGVGGGAEGGDTRGSVKSLGLW